MSDTQPGDGVQADVTTPRDDDGTAVPEGTPADQVGQNDEGTQREDSASDLGTDPGGAPAGDVDVDVEVNGGTQAPGTSPAGQPDAGPTGDGTPEQPDQQ